MLCKWDIGGDYILSGAYPGFSEGGGGVPRGGGGGCRDPPKKLTSQRSARLS